MIHPRYRSCWMMIQVIYFFSVTSFELEDIWDRRHQFVGLGTVLQLLSVLKSVRLSYSISIALHAFLWFQKSCRKLIRHWWCLMDNNWWTQQQAFHPTNFCIKDLLTLSVHESVSETVLFALRLITDISVSALDWITCVLGVTFWDSSLCSCNFGPSLQNKWGQTWVILPHELFQREAQQC